jgi:hypothetical protein
MKEFEFISPGRWMPLSQSQTGSATDPLLQFNPENPREEKRPRIYRKTGSLRAVQLLLGHTKLESTVRYLGIEMDDALNMAEQIEL